MDVVNYAYPSARIRGMKSYLLSGEKINELIRADDLEEFLELLNDTYYSDILTDLKEKNITEIERILLHDLFSVVEKVFIMSPKNSSKLFFMMLKYYEIQSIKEVISKKINNENINLDIYPSRNKLLLERISKSTTLDEISNLLMENKYIDSSQISEPMELLFYLDKYFYMKLFDVLNSLNDRGAMHLIGPEFDFLNLMLILRFKNLGICEKSIIQDYAVPGYKVREFENLISAESIEDIVSILEGSAYSNPLNDGLRFYTEKKSLLGFEISFRRFLIELYKNAFLGCPFSVTLLLAYIRLKENEIRNLRSISIGIVYGIDKYEIENLVVV
ncbi:MAG: hypothetical protein DRO90_00870 [Candidatus Altiarchaeales archaeon]|nr:MAG: hypothetical protein DRO94_01375 [Candidatus Altiarchaeales archaeon]RLI95118.1 MAG: hypothetical protein DRO90_00870 [Candidatus Altiarchaeales archaeon]